MTTYILIFLLGILKSLSDLSAEANDGLPPQWHKSKSWKNKWENYPMANRRPSWMYLWLFTPVYQEKFLYSSTWLVSFTDVWHKFELLSFICVVFAILFYNPYIWYIDFVALAGARQLGFSVTYKLLKEV